MKYLKSLAIIISLLSISMCPANISAKPLPMTQPERVGMSGERLQKVDAVINDSIAHKDTPGAVLLVARKGKIVYKKAYGNQMIEPKVEKMTLDTIFDMASLTKPTATASGIMKLVEDGKIRLGDTVSRYIPEFASNGKDKVTLFHLITHTSGLPGWDKYFEKKLDHDGIIKDIASKSTTFPPGTKYLYSDLGYITLGEIITRVSGKSENDFDKENIFKPLGMTDTEFNPPKEKWDRCVATEPRNGKMLQGQVHDGNSWALGGIAGHAGLFSTVDEMAIYCQMLLNGGEYNGVRIFSPLTIREMIKDQTPELDVARGYGWGIISPHSSQPGDIFGRAGFGHYGWTGTCVNVDPSTQTILILLCNRNHPDGKGDMTNMRALVSNIVASAIIDEK